VSATTRLRPAIVGLIGFAATEEEMLLAGAGRDVADSGNEGWWAAVPTVAHNTEFKAQQAQRVSAVLAGRTPPAFADIDHASAAVYAAYAALPADAVAASSRQVTATLREAGRLAEILAG
jgi:hypothetical protein